MKGVKDGEQCSIKRGGKEEERGEGPRRCDRGEEEQCDTVGWGGGVGAQSRESLSHRLKVTQRRKHSI